MCYRIYRYGSCFPVCKEQKTKLEKGTETMKWFLVFIVGGMVLWLVVMWVVKVAVAEPDWPSTYPLDMSVPVIEKTNTVY